MLSENKGDSCWGSPFVNLPNLDTPNAIFCMFNILLCCLIDHLCLKSNKFWKCFLKLFVFLLFRIGGESLAVAQNTYAVSWFKGKELNTVFGLQLSMARVGSTVNFLSMVPLYNWVQTFSDGYRALGYSLLFGMYFGNFVIRNYIYCCISIRAELKHYVQMYLK